MPSSRYERAARSAGYRTIAGLDEAGRGALFGPVFAAAVVLDPARQIRGLDDSKQLDPDRREVLAERIRERAVAWAVGAADAFEIDRVNILEASRLAMQRALASVLTRVCDYLVVRRDPDRLRSPAKTSHPRRFPVLLYRRCLDPRENRPRPRPDAMGRKSSRNIGLAHNKGYGTRDHLDALDRLGPTTLHRFSFEPVRNSSRHSAWTGYPAALSPQGDLFV